MRRRRHVFLVLQRFLLFCNLFVFLRSCLSCGGEKEFGEERELTIES
jgi:hypothetical protein